MRKFLSIALTINFILLLITVISVMGGHHHGMSHAGRPPFVSPGGHFDRGPHPEGGDGFLPMPVHEFAGTLFLVLGLVHLVYNRKCLFSYLGIGRRRSGAASKQL